MGTRSEDEIGEKWDRCLADSLVKMGSGVGVGLIFSLVLFKRRSWPVTFGLGTGLGMGIANCQHDFNTPYYSRVYALKKKEVASTKTQTQ